MRNDLRFAGAVRAEAVLTVVRLMGRDMANADAPTSLGSASGNVVLVGTRWEATKPFTQGRGPSKIAVIPVQGILTNDGPSYYGSNYQDIGDAVEKAAADPDVKRIVLAVDSPGGEVTGLPETSDLLASIAKVKPISAIVEGAAASAAYWLTSQASDITLTPSGEVGSVGVRMMHVDISKMLDAEGYTVTEIHSGAFKTEWSPYKPLSDAARADMQSRLDDAHADFLGAVARGRGNRVSATMRAARFGEGRMHSSKEALRHGLVDRVQSPRMFYRSLAASLAAPSGVGAYALSASSESPITVARAQLEMARLRT